MFDSEMTPEEVQAEFEDFLAWQEEMAAEEAAMTPEQKEYLRQAEARVREEEAIGELYASQWAFDWFDKSRETWSGTQTIKCQVNYVN